MVRSSSVAAALAVLPNHDGAEPRVIQQFTSIFLVSRYGELWRVYDCDEPDGRGRHMPSPIHHSPARIFVALARDPETRLHGFSAGEAHAVEPLLLQLQLDSSARM